MAIALDHVFICCSVGAPEAAALQRLGLKESSPNTHPGQGTACRRFSFANAYLELLWVSDAEEARSDPVRRTRLWERWSGRRSSSTSASRSAPAQAVELAGVLSFRPAEEHVLTLAFDGEESRQAADLRPELPLVLRW